MVMLPSSILPAQPWTGGLEFKTLCSKYPYTTCHFSMARDTSTGRIYPDPVDGRCRIAYTPSAFDLKHLLEGLLALGKILYIEGAKEIWLSTGGMPSFTRSEDAASQDNGDGINDPAFQSWLAEISRRGLSLPETRVGSAHQMGTCRMSAKEKDGVVDPKGKVWGVDGLFVSDASVFPSSSGVNPMVTNMAISDWVSRGIAKDLRT